MAFKISVVKNCPVTRASKGKLIIPPDLLGEFAGTMQAERGQEWLVLLKGYRSADGMEVRVTGVEVPTEQRRRPAHVEIDQQPIASWERGTAHLVERVVGVLHSHNEMAPRFSGTDYATLNDRFEVSIVISSKTPDEESTWLGFSYNAEGRVKLPCGSVGVVAFSVVPEGLEDWPVEERFGFYSNGKQDLGDCCKPQIDAIEGNRYKVVQFGRCGLTSPQEILQAGIFGAGQQQIKALLPPPQEDKWVWKGYNPLQPAPYAGPLRVEDKRRLLEPAGAIEKAYANAGFEIVGESECDVCCEPIKKGWMVEDFFLCASCKKDDDEWKGYGKPIEDEIDLIEDTAWRERLEEIYEERGCS